MANSYDLSELLDRIANGEETDRDRQVLQQLLSDQEGQSVVQLGKYTVNLGQGREIHVGDRIYHGADADTIKVMIQAMLQQAVQRSPLTPQEYRNRQALLNKVKNFWVKGVLETSLHHQVVIQLGLEDRFDALATPWNLGVEATGQPQSTLPEGTTVIDLFDQLGIGRTLLILGEPGAGKTVTLLQLARELIERAEQDTDHLIPVVFNLSSWNKSFSLADWLIAELNIKYQVPKAIAKPWVTQQQLLLLLDGLDEVRAEHQDACVVALVVQRSPERLAVARVLNETGIAETGRFMRRLSSPTQSKSHGNTPLVSSTARPIASMGHTQRPTAPPRVR